MNIYLYIYIVYTYACYTHVLEPCHAHIIYIHIIHQARTPSIGSLLRHLIAVGGHGKWLTQMNRRMVCRYMCIYIYIHIPRPSRCAFFLPFAEKAIYCVVCSKKSLFLLKVPLQNLAKTWSANVAFWSGNVAFGSGNVAFSSSSWFRKTAKYAKIR